MRPVNWKKAIVGTLSIGAGILVAVAGAAYIIAHTQAFNRFALAKIIEKSENATGGKVDIERMEIHWNRLGVDFYDVALFGSGGNSQLPVLRARHLGIGLNVVSILRRQIDLSEIVLDEPALDLRVDAKGNTNLPKSATPSAPSNPADAVFNAAIGHLLIESGRIHYNDREIPLSANLTNFRADIRYSPLSSQYSGSLGYDRGRVVAQGFNPIDHGAQLKFAASRSELDIDPVVFSVENSHLTARARLSNYANPEIQGTYDAVLFTEGIRQILKEPSLPSGRVSVSGALRYRNIPNVPFINAVYIDGRISSPQINVRAGQVSTEAKSIRGAFSLEKGSLQIADVGADILQGHLSAAGEVLDIAGRPSARIAGTLQRVSLEAVSSALPPGGYNRVHFTGRANAEAEVSWSGGMQNIVAHSRITIASPVRDTTASGQIPLNGTIDVRYDAARGTASFGDSHLRTGATQISLSGTLSKQSRLLVQASTTDLHEVAALVSEIEAAAAGPSHGAPPSPFDIHGAAHLSTQVAGSTKNPNIQGQISGSDLEMKGDRWRAFRSDIALSPSHVALQHAVLISARQGQIDFSAQAALDRWSFKSTSPFSAEVKGAGLRMADLERLGQLHYPVTGVLDANVSMQGSGMNLAGRGSVHVVKASAWNEPIDALDLDFQGSGNTIQSTAQLHIPAGSVTAKLTYSPQSGQYDARIESSALKLEQINAVQARDLGLTGVVSVSASGNGTLKDPELSSQLRIAKLQIRGQSVSDTSAALNVARHHAHFTVHSVVAQGNVDARGDVELSGGYNTAASIVVRALPIGALLASYLSGSQTNLKGQTEIHAQLSGPLKNPSQMQGHLEIPALDLEYQALNIALVRPLRLDYRDGIATLQQTELKGTGADLTLQGTIPVTSASTAFSLGANGTLDLSLLQTLTKGVKSSGRVELALTGRGGDFKHPAMQGHLRIENAYLSTNSVPVGIEGLSGVLNISGDRVDIAQLMGTVGGGAITAQGSMVYASQPSFNVGLRGKSVRVRYPDGLRSILDCDLQLNGNTADSTLSGRVVVDRLSFTQQFDLANFAGQFGESSVASTAGALQQNMKVNVAIQSARDVNLVSSQLSMQGTANLNLTGTMANPVILGRVNLTGGDIFFLGKRYEVRNGTIEFSNPVHTEPVVNLYVATSVDQYNITLNFVGPVDQLRTTYTSDPALPPSDIINLLALGKTGAESAQNTTPATVGAESVIAQGVASQVSGKIQRLAGISQLTIDPMAGNNQTNPGAQVAIQKRVTGNILLTFSTDVTSTQATTVQLQYRTSRQTSVTVLRDQNGGYAIALRLHKSF